MSNNDSPVVGVIMGSQSDWPTLGIHAYPHGICTYEAKVVVPTELLICSMNTPDRLNPED